MVAVERRVRRRTYDEAERSTLALLWEASDRVCGKRLRALSPVLIEAMERHGHLTLAPEIRSKTAGDECVNDRPSTRADSRTSGTTAPAGRGKRAEAQHPNTDIGRLG